MTPETERLLEQLAEFRANPQSVSVQQPKFTGWVNAVRHWLRFREDREALGRFEALRLSRATGAMWKRDESSPAEVRELLSDLGEVEKLLRRDNGKAAPAPVARKPERPAGGERVGRGPAPGGHDEEEAPLKDKNGTPGAPGQPQPPASPTRLRAMEALLSELEQEIKRPDGDVGKIQKVMAELLELKKLGDLIDRVLASASEPECRWETLRGPLAQLWSANRDAVVDLLPALLKRG
ncbi:MAG: hypothetical protein SCH98_03995 [Deferrisomatales bacterium]|nr:hypothetical protein [Deferrisomatales bacterium]